jgi:NDP-sugar pyrophosphorylase family protein
MKAIILAAGRGKRMEHLSADIPKPMLKVLGKTLLHHKLDAIPEEITEVVIVVGYLKDKIIEEIGTEYRGKKITYVINEEAEKGIFYGTAYATFICKDLFKDKDERFLVMMGDDIYPTEDMRNCLQHDWSILVREIPSLIGKAKVVTDEEGHIIEIREKSQIDEPGYVCAGMYTMTPKIFEYEMVPIGGGEFGLPQTILSARSDVKIKSVVSNGWFQITAPEDIIAAEKFFSKNEK